MTDKSAAAIREFAEKWGYTLEGWIDPLTGQPGKVLQPAPDKCLSDLTALISEHYVSKEDVNLEVEKRIKERMPSEEEIEKHFTTPHYHYEKGRYYKVRKDRIFGAKWLRSRLTNPGVNDSQKTEGGGE